MHMALFRVLAIFSFITISTAVTGQTITIATFNTESGSDTQTFQVAKTIRNVGFVDVWALQEVADKNAAIEYNVAAGAVGKRKSFRYVVSESGQTGALHRRNDLLVIVYNSSTYRQVETIELHGIRSKLGSGRLGDAEWNLRGALFLRLQDKATGIEFYVGNVHLKCCVEGKDIRAHQATILRDWIARSDVPVILTGDFNIPIPPHSTTGNTTSDAFNALNAVAAWRRPTNPVKTQCSPKFNSMLDHFFVKDGPNLETVRVMVAEPRTSYCNLDSEGYSDHRPVIAEFALQP